MVAGRSFRALAQILQEVDDPGCPRGVRFPFSGILSLAFLGLLCRIREMKTLQSWAATHWHILAEPLGFERPQPPHATTISRALANFTIADFQELFARWLLTLVDDEDLAAVAVDGKTACQGYEDGSPVQMLSVFAQQANIVLTQWPVGSEKTNEPGVLRNHLQELLEKFPMIRLLTGDAIFAQRPLAELFTNQDCDYLLQVKNNQPDLLDAAEQCFEHRGVADAEMIEKKREPSRLVACGVMSRTRTTVVSDLTSLAADCSSAWSVWSLGAGRKLVVM